MIGQGLYQAGDYLTPDFYSRNTPAGSTGAYSEQEWSDWYGKSRTYGTPEFAQHLDWMDLAKPRLQQRLQEYLAHLESLPQMESDGQPSSAALAIASLKDPNIGGAMRRQILGLPQDPNVSRVPSVMAQANLGTHAFFGWMSDTSIDGFERPDTSVTPEKMQEWKQDPDWGRRMQADWRMTPAGQEAFTKLMDYNLLNAFQQGEHQPEPLRMPALSYIGGNLGSAFEAAAYGPQSGNPGTKIGSAQTTLLTRPSPANAVQYAMEVARFAETQDPEFYNSWLMGSQAPQMSLMTGMGLARKSGSGDTPYGRATRYLTTLLMMPHYNTDERRAVVDFMNTNDRFTPVRPEGAYEEAEALRSRVGNLENENWKQVSAYLPKWIRDFNSVFAASPAAWGGEMPQAPAGQKIDPRNAWVGPQAVPLSKEEQEYEDWRKEQGGSQPAADSDPWAKVGITPFHSTAAFNDMAMVGPAIAGDPSAYVTAGLTGPFAGIASRMAGASPYRSAVNALKSMMSGFREAPAEAGYNTALSLAITPQTPYEYFTQPDPANPVRDSSGQIPAADSSQYPKALRNWEQQNQGIVTDVQKYEDKNGLRRPKPAANNATQSLRRRPFTD